MKENLPIISQIFSTFAGFLAGGGAGGGRALVLPDAAACLQAASIAPLFALVPFVLPDIRAEIGDSAADFRDELCELVGILQGYEAACAAVQIPTPSENPLFSQNPVQIPTPETAAATAGENPLFCGEAIAAEISPNASAGVLEYVKRAPERSEGDLAKFTRESEPNPFAKNSLAASIYHAYACARARGAILLIPAATAQLRLPPLAGAIEFRALERVADFAQLAQRLLAANFAPAPTVLSGGEFCLAAGKLDFLNPGAERGFRVVFFDDEVESIREFDPASQLSTGAELEFAAALPLPGELFCQDFAPLAGRYNAGELAAPNPAIAAENWHICQEFFAHHESEPIMLLASNESKLATLALGKNVHVLRTHAHANLRIPGALVVSLNAPARARKIRRVRTDLNSLRPGDYVVHERYGIGKFAGLELVHSGGCTSECLRLLYAGGNALLLPTNALAAIEPYAASSTPQLDSLGKASFARAKAKAAEKLFAIAGEIAELAAARALVAAPKISRPLDFALFLHAAGFAHTADQLRAIDEIFEDFARGYPMDRLLAADVGFGKTEVAMCAAYAAARAGLSVAVMVPTTLLCAQHANTFSRRFEHFGVPVFELLSSKKASVLKKFNATAGGKIIVGTHNLLSAELGAVGLLVVDEEHKFGVKQKEKLKQLASRAHLLSMSATPIPRSLSGALSGLKSYSEIATPPNERVGTRTQVALQDDAAIKAALLKERRRGGQIFYVHNRLATLEQKAQYLRALLPNLSVKTLSSASTAAQKEEILREFLAGEFEVLCSTSIVESGLDMPRANTIIIERADLFGVADLHQLRGRVGRGARQGFCYFLHDEQIAASAAERLSALASNSYLGAGAALAQMDLQLRGGGNLLGEQQSGHIEALGYGLYVRMLEEALNARTRGVGAGAGECEMKLLVSAYIDAEAVSDDGLRLEFYRRASRAKTPGELGALEDEFADRFGRAEGASARYFALMRLKLAAQAAGVRLLSSFETTVRAQLASGESLTARAAEASDDAILQTAANLLATIAH